MQAIERKDGWQALLGPIVLGAVLGIPLGTSALLKEALILPSVLFGTTLLMVPALYIGATILGVAPSASTVGKALVRSLISCGAMLLGLSPLCAFLLLTTTNVELVWFLGTGALTASILLGLRALRETMFDSNQKTHIWLPLFWVWAGLSLLVGERLFTKTLVGL